MKKLSRLTIVAIVVAGLVGLASFDVIFHETGTAARRTSYSPTVHLFCVLSGDGRRYQPIGKHGWSTDSVNGYWCMNDAEIEAFDRSRG